MNILIRQKTDNCNCYAIKIVNHTTQITAENTRGKDLSTKHMCLRAVACTDSERNGREREREGGGEDEKSRMVARGQDTNYI